MELNKLDGELEILVEYSEHPTVTLRGEVDFRNMSRVKQAIFGLVESGKASIQVDLRELVFMDSTGVSALVDAARAAIPKGGRVTLVSPSEQLAKVLDRCGFLEVFRYRSTGQTSPSNECAVIADTPDLLEFETPSRPEMISHIRSRVAQYACSMPFSPDDIEDIKLAVGEACANAMKHGASPDWCKVGVTVRRADNSLVIQIRDRGCGFDPHCVNAPEPGELVSGGRGILFMRALMDEVQFSFDGPGTCVVMTKRTPALS